MKKPLIRIAWRYAILIVVLCVSIQFNCNIARAHFPWIVLPSDGSREFSVVFSEDMLPDDPTYLKKIAPHKARLHTASGTQQIDLTLHENRLIGQIPNGVNVAMIELPFTWGIFSRGDSKFLLQYRAMAVLDIQAAARLALSHGFADGPLLMIHSQSDGLALSALSSDKPLTKESIRVQGPEAVELTTNEAGKSDWRPAKAGIYGMVAKSTIAQSGKWEGDEYPEIRAYTTLVVRIEKGFSDPTRNDAPTKAVSSTHASSSFPPLPLALTSFGAARVGDSVFVYGGHTGSTHSYSNKEQSNQLLRLNVKSPNPIWENVSQGPRLQGLALVAHRNRVIRIGGFAARNAEGAEQDLHSSNSVAAYDTTTNQWSDLPSLPEARSSHDAIAIGDIVYVAGGWNMDNPNENQWHTTAYAMNLASSDPHWVELPKPNFSRRAMALATHHGKLYVIGGMGQTGGPSTETEVFDTVTGKWSDGPSLVGEPISGFGAAAIDIDGHLIVSTVTGDIQQLSDDGSKWIIVGKTKDARFFHRLLPLASHELLSVGGANMESGKFLDLETFHVR